MGERILPSHPGADSLVVGVYRGKDLHYVYVRAGFMPATRQKVYDAIKHLTTKNYPFVNLPEKEAGRWGQGLTAEKMARCVWVRPESVAEVATTCGIRSSSDIAMIRMIPRKIVRET